MGSAVFDLARLCYDVVLYCVMKQRNFHALPVASKQTIQSDLNFISFDKPNKYLMIRYPANDKDIQY